MFRIHIGLVLVAVAWGQAGVDGLNFEVASVKRSEKQGMITRSQGGPETSDPGRFRTTNAEVHMLVNRAYATNCGVVEVKGPAWVDTTQFDVEAKVPSGTTLDQFRKMLQNLLAERFHLQVHHVTRVASIYELTVAKNGPKLKPAIEDGGTDDLVLGGPGRVDRNDFPILPHGRPNVACQSGPEGSRCTYRMTTMALLAGRLSLSNAVGSCVVDKTGLAGRYDFNLYYRAMSLPPPDPEDSAPSIEQALQEQLGLKLAPSKAAIDVLVIDSAVAPTEN